jgi:two-component system NtrC family sensor kinase
MQLNNDFHLSQNFQEQVFSSYLTSQKKQTILLVDDTPANLKMVGDFLTDSGFEVRVAKSGLQALKILENISPDMILLDVMMPEIDGFETCRRLKAWEKTKYIPVIFMTAISDFANPENKVKGLKLGAVDYISKPIQLDEVLARITNHLQLRSLTKQIQEQRVLLEAIFNESADAIFLVNPETGWIIDCNQRAVELFEAESKEELLNIEGQSLQKKRFSPGELSFILDEIERQGFSSRELEYVTKKGKILWGNMAAKQIYVAGEKINFVWVTDITERKQAEEALRLSEEQERKKALELQLALDELKHTQAQLIQAEKMSSLGRMVARVFNEMNNPIGFILGNLTPARDYFQDLHSLVELYQQNYPNSTPEIKAKLEEIEFDFLVQDWSKMINSMQLGAQRINQILNSLNSFSRLDEAELKIVDIHDCIDNTLFLMSNQLRAEGKRPEIKVIKNYAQLPEITCYASQMNQVFMNLLDNAIEALENKTEPRLITISTSMLMKDSPIPNSQFVVIRIADNGSGISKELQPKIFEPFFTTKPIGNGTGLGLAMAQQIVVKKHGGQISCLSTPGQNTEFIVEIPVR